MDLTLISPADFNVEIDLKYASGDNFTGKPVYKSTAKCYLHRDAALCLKKAVSLASELGLRFRIYDAYRPGEAQRKLWEHTPDPDFLADPAKGSPHSRGVAIDLTLIDAAGKPLEMGTAFDAFTPLSHHGSAGLTPEAQRGRMLLLGIMTTAGWDFYRNEWWHYQLYNARNYPVLDDRDTGTGMM